MLLSSAAAFSVILISILTLLYTFYLYPHRVYFNYNANFLENQVKIVEINANLDGVYSCTYKNKDKVDMHCEQQVKK